ncbi:MAG: aldo/keto reductase, partial [Desulfobulbaceae bacterium]|nr:aldo/keto reductase [Candidatus Desulfobia pelagia]
MKTILFGSTGREVSKAGLGGEGVLRTYGRQKEAEAV